jgi:1-acyl-sn-glycerol-3-phosphate acyltransferase
VTFPPSFRSLVFTSRVAVVLGALLPILWLRLAVTRDGRRRLALVRACAVRVLRFSGCRIALDMQHVLSGDERVMLVSNHASLADAAVLLGTLPGEFRFVANHVFAQYPILGAAIRAASAHIVDRGSLRSRGECGRTMIAALEGQQSLLVFPEGTTSHGHGLLPFRNGAFRAAASSQASVVPIVLHGTGTMFPPGSMWLHDVPVRIEILPPIHPAGASRGDVVDLRQRTVAAIERRLHATYR